MAGAAFLLVLGMILLWIVWSGRAVAIKNALLNPSGGATARPG